MQRTLELLAELAGQAVPSCTGAVRDQLGRGWTPHQIADHVRSTGDPRTGSRNVAAVVRSRVEQMDTPAPPLPPKCTSCDASRMVELPDGRMARCPTCNPNRAAS
ncbi:hypothetical protein [Kribbella sp. NPDC051137]|uniref:hypothetical protein n=1 Tax=Kribbella sp. NPDC051137 TaxID=3155045 RepID=UPI00343AAA4A